MASENSIVVDLLLNNVDKSLNTIKDFSSQATKSVKSVEDGFNFLGNAAKAAIALFAFDKIAEGFKKVTDEAAKQEDAVNQLNFSLKASGQYSKAASEGLIEFSEQLQKNSKFANDAIIKNAAYLESLTGLNDVGLKRAMQGAVDLASVLHIDLETATLAVAKGIEGNTTSLNKMGIQFVKSADPLKNFSNLMAALDKNSGAAESATKTFSGAIAQLSNNFDDQLKTLGEIIIKNPAVIASFNELNKTLTELGKNLSENSSTISGVVTTSFNGLAKSIKFLNDGFQLLAENIKPILIFLAGVAAVAAVIFIPFTAVGAAIAAAIDGIIILIAQFGAAEAVLAPLIGGLTALGIFTDRAGDSADKTADKYGKLSGQIRKSTDDAAEFVKKLEEIGKNTNFTNEINQQRLEQLQARVASASSAPVGNVTIRPSEEKIDEAKKAINDLSKQLGDAFLKINIEEKERLKTLQENIAVLKLGAKSQAERNQIEANYEKLRGQILKDTAEKTNEEIKKVYDKLGAYGDNAVTAAQRDYQKTIDEIGKLPIAEKDKAQLRLEAVQKLGDDLIEAELKAAAQRKKQFENSFKIGPLSGQQVLGFMSSAITDLGKGADGAADAVKNLGSLVADFFHQGLGQLVGPLIQLLEMSPQQLKEAVSSFFDSLPKVIETIAANIPTLLVEVTKGIQSALITLVEDLPNIIVEFINSFIESFTDPDNMTTFAINFTTALVEMVPNVIEAIIADIPHIVEVIIQHIPLMIENFVKTMVVNIPRIAIAMAIGFTLEFIRHIPLIIQNFISHIPEIISEFTKGLVEGAKRFVETCVNGIKDFFENILGGGGGDGGGFFGGMHGATRIGAAVATGGLSEVGRFLGFAEGGIVPGTSYAGDKVLARVNSGEFVIDRSLTEELAGFLKDQKYSGSSQPVAVQDSQQYITINLQVGEDKLASVLLNLKRRGLRYE